MVAVVLMVKEKRGCYKGVSNKEVTNISATTILFKFVLKKEVSISNVTNTNLNDIKNKIEQIVWMVDGVEVGPVIEFIKEKGIWKQTFYKGIYNAAKDAGISRIIFN